MDTPYIVSARKYRPSTFRSVVGQKALTSTLKNAIDSGRLAQAYMFCGPRGVGKTSCARIFAKTINCLHPTAEGEACNECESCRAFNEGRSINVVELDAASNNSVDNIRNLNDQVRIPPQIGRYRVFIIDEVHMLSTAAFNAFLKTLEEPPSYVIFILATTEKHKVIPTILSRCQIYDFSRITVADIAEHLAYVASQEGIQAEPAALNVIARKADGAMRDALSIFDQVAASCQGNITYAGTIANLNVLDYDYHFRLVSAFLEGNVPEALLIYKEIRDAGFNSLSFINALGSHIRDLLVAADPRTLPLLEVSQDVAGQYKTQAAMIKPRWAYQAMNLISDCDLHYRTATNKQFLVELTLIRLSQLLNPEGAAVQQGHPSRPALQPIAAAQARPATPAPADGTQVMASPPPPAYQTAPPQSSPQSPQRHTVPAPVQSPDSAHRAARRPATLRINATAPQRPAESAHQAATSAAAPVQTAANTAPVDFETLKRAWSSFMQQHTEQRILVSTMRVSEPVPTDNPVVFSVLVDNPAQQQTFEDSTMLLSYLRQATGNQALRLDIKVDTSGSRPRMLTQAEQLQKIVSEHPTIGYILNDLEADLVS